MIFDVLSEASTCTNEFFPRGHLTSKVYTKNSLYLHQFREIIRKEMAAATENTYREVLRNLDSRLQEGHRNKGPHLVHIIFKELKLDVFAKQSLFD